MSITGGIQHTMKGRGARTSKWGLGKEMREVQIREVDLLLLCLTLRGLLSSRALLHIFNDHLIVVMRPH